MVRVWGEECHLGAGGLYAGSGIDSECHNDMSMALSMSLVTGGYVLT